MKINVSAIWAAVMAFLVKVIVFLKIHISWSADWAATLTGLRAAWGVVKVSYRQPSVLVVWGAIAVGWFLFGHVQEAWKWEESAAITKAKTDKALSAATAATKVAKDDAAAARAELELARKKQAAPAAVDAPPPAPRRRASPATKAWWQ